MYREGTLHYPVRNVFNTVLHIQSTQSVTHSAPNGLTESVNFLKLTFRIGRSRLTP